jgi:hypothetical protein
MSQAKGVRIMARDVTITERPIPPKGRLSFPLLMLRMIGNPVASWSEDFYVYRWLGLENVFVMDPELIQTILLDGAGRGARPRPCSGRRSSSLTCQLLRRHARGCLPFGATQCPALFSSSAGI